jgi:hypothetical protein
LRVFHPQICSTGCRLVNRALGPENLRRLGVPCLEALYNRLDTDLINRYLAIKQREMI